MARPNISWFAGKSFKTTYGSDTPRYYMKEDEAGRWQRINETLYELADMLAAVTHADWFNEYPKHGAESIGFTLPDSFEQQTWEEVENKL